MSKITFRADDELIDELETFDASKSEVMRDALRTYLEGGQSRSSRDSESERNESAHESDSIDNILRERIDTVLTERLEQRHPRNRQPQDVNVTVDLEGVGQQRKTQAAPETEPDVTQPVDTGRETNPSTPSECGQCGEPVSGDHVYCPNCGEKASRRLFCECGDELRSDWSFCPGCGRRTAAADVLDANGPRSRNS